jgi:hypothetical protein
MARLLDKPKATNQQPDAKVLTALLCWTSCVRRPRAVVVAI